jgi:hypothetical protein
MVVLFVFARGVAGDAAATTSYIVQNLFHPGLPILVYAAGHLFYPRFIPFREIVLLWRKGSGLEGKDHLWCTPLLPFVTMNAAFSFFPQQISATTSKFSQEMIKANV